MPRRNPGRSRGPEADVAARIAMERERRAMPAAELARRMTAAGCPMNQSAINKIEQGDPPRRVTVDELVAFARVFQLDVTELLLPPHEARQHEIVETYRQLMADEVVLSVIAATNIEMGARLMRLLEAEGEPSAEAARQSYVEYQEALKRLTQAIAGLSEAVAEALRRSPFPNDDGRSMSPRTPMGGPQRRAAEAAAGIPPTTRQRPKKPPRSGGA